MDPVDQSRISREDLIKQFLTEDNPNLELSADSVSSVIANLDDCFLRSVEVCLLLIVLVRSILLLLLPLDRGWSLTRLGKVRKGWKGW